MQSATEYWGEVSDVDIVTAAEGEGEAGKAKERLTAERLDQLAVYFSAPDSVRRKWGVRDHRELALLVGCRLKSIEKWKRNPAMVRRCAEMLTAAAVYMMPNILYAQAQLAAGDTRAANFVATVGKFIRTGMTVSQTNVSPVAEVTRPQTTAELYKQMDSYFESRMDQGEQA